ncbi:MAG: NADH-quinone oxidoreductase subunit J [Candidatus Limnocylindrales bacterium]
MPLGGALFEGFGLPPFVPFLNWAWDDLLFLALSGVLLGAAIFVVIGRDIVRSGLSMILAFAALAGIYALAGAVVVAAAQVLIYIGAISVLILFAIMLTQTKSGPAQLVFHSQAWAGALAAVGLAFLLIIAVINTQWPLVGTEPLHAGNEAVALLLFNDARYVFALQIIAVLLTAAVIGAVFLAKREDAPDPGERSIDRPNALGMAESSGAPAMSQKP